MLSIGYTLSDYMDACGSRQHLPQSLHSWFSTQRFYIFWGQRCFDFQVFGLSGRGYFTRSARLHVLQPVIELEAFNVKLLLATQVHFYLCSLRQGRLSKGFVKFCIWAVSHSESTTHASHRDSSLGWINVSSITLDHIVLTQMLHIISTSFTKVVINFGSTSRAFARVEKFPHLEVFERSIPVYHPREPLTTSFILLT